MADECGNAIWVRLYISLHTATVQWDKMQIQVQITYHKYNNKLFWKLSILWLGILCKLWISGGETINTTNLDQAWRWKTLKMRIKHCQKWLLWFALLIIFDFDYFLRKCDLLILWNIKSWCLLMPTIDLRAQNSYTLDLLFYLNYRSVMTKNFR